jgi:aminoglycoside phosphotransferase (APT) family kinase protein
MQRLASRSEMITEPIRRLWKQALNSPLDRAPTWLHGDLHPRNVLVQGGVITGVIDWGDITSGDCATDLASIWMLFAETTAHREAFAAYGNLF